MPQNELMAMYSIKKYRGTIMYNQHQQPKENRARQTRTQHLNSNTPNHSNWKKKKKKKSRTVSFRSLYKRMNHTANIVQYPHAGWNLILLKGGGEEMLKIVREELGRNQFPSVRSWPWVFWIGDDDDDVNRLVQAMLIVTKRQQNIHWCTLHH